MHALRRLVGMGSDHLIPEALGHDLDGAEDELARHSRMVR